jgi:DNA-binding response OmpR family regulator
MGTAVTVVAAANGWVSDLIDVLRLDGFVAALDGAAAFIDRDTLLWPDVVVLDLGLRGRSPVELCADIRGRSRTPIVAARNDASDDIVVAALAAGVDSLADSSARSRELAARVRAVLRRPTKPVTPLDVIRAGPVTVDVSTRLVTMAGEHVELGEADFDLLALLVEHSGQVVRRRDLVARLPSTNGGDASLDLHIRRLRARLEEHDGRRRITAIRSVGFRFEAEAGAS